MSEVKRKYDLEERLINFAVLTIEHVETMPNTTSSACVPQTEIEFGKVPACEDTGRGLEIEFGKVPVCEDTDRRVRIDV